MIRIGIICPSEIALRRFLPALNKASEKFIFAGIAIASPEEWFGDLTNVSDEQIEQQQDKEFEKALIFESKVFKSYETIIKSDEIDAIYIPLPPALHYKWAKLALENGKHVFMEKPFTCSMTDTVELINIASKNQLALHENYMFIFHDQLQALQDVINSGEIGDIRHYRISFGFPRRTANDFRYNKKLGGGALLDAGGYTIKYATYLLGNSAHLSAANVNYLPEYEVEMFGSATVVNATGQVAQLAFGMDNDYKCEIEIWGSQGSLITSRILTAPAGFIPTYTIKKNQDIETRNLPSDDAFMKSILYFNNCIENADLREYNYTILHKQESMLEEFKKLGGLE
ncbi:NDP-hexose-3-ketoreductase [Flavobacterium ammoniigenes]|uniref:NDP-hexose-3-ketoreductase n=1 Tax=Flavobacterium ammoniigenes TaxID=1751095 RepID=A0ABM7V587_9FLAO|nr:Gfo/Idh/MocA family oxidoreductase [Flavobacterium ammoniigenes]BDB54714.1 NDP-hexose-3-ketoreductase [Flavobacterium ammoniigenes]